MGIWVGCFAIVGGEVRERGPWLAEQRRVNEDESVRLLVLVEPLDERSAEVSAEVAAAVADLFMQESLSLTGGLLRALRQAHANLAEWNRQSLREHRVTVGVTCVAVREQQATIVQVGPGLVYIANGDGVRRVTTEGEPASRPLGVAEAIEPQFLSVSIVGTQILMLTSSAESAAEPPAIGQALAAGPERTLADLFLRTREVRDLTAVLVADLDLPEEEIEAAPVDIDLPKFSTLGTDVYAPAERPLEPERASVPGALQVPRDVPTGRSRPLPTLRRIRVAGGTPGPPWQLLSLLFAGAVALAVLAFVLLEGDSEGRLEQRLEVVNNLFAASNLTMDVDEQRANLQSALEELEEARSIDAQDQRVSSLRAIVQQRLNRLNAVFEIRDLTRILQFEGTLTAPLSPAGLVAGGGWLWLLDGERGRVFIVDPAGVSDPIETYRAGQTYGAAVAGDPLAITWDDVGGRLLLLDDERTLFASVPGQAPVVLPLRDATELSAVNALAAYDGNLYVLDSATGEVWRYLPAGAGFDSERSALLGGIQIDDAKTLAVDGDIYLVGADAVRRFSVGRELDPLLQGIDRPIKAPAGVAEDVDRGLLYVADRGGRRIVVGRRDGAFLRQYVHPDFLDLRGLAIAPDGMMLYVLTGEEIVAFDPGPDTFSALTS